MASLVFRSSSHFLSIKAPAKFMKNQANHYSIAVIGNKFHWSVSTAAISRVDKRQKSSPLIEQRRTFVSEIVTSIQTVSQTIQTSLHDFHTWSGLPWWFSIAASTVLVRSATFPLVRKQIIVSRKLGAAMPEISFLSQLLTSRLRTIPVSDVSQRMNLIQTYLKGVKACFVVHDVSIAQIFLYPMINIAVFVTFVFSLRDMVLHGPVSWGLEQGGMGWFPDLTEKDKTFLLPVYATSLSYLAIELGTAGTQGRVAMFLKDALQCIILFSLPMVTQLPAGVFCYWIPSSCFGIMQSQLLKNPKFQTFFRIPLAKPPMKKP